MYKVYETIPPLVTSWYTIWAKVILIVATYHIVVTPFVVLRKVGSRAYEIELPDRWEIYPVFHVGLLEPYREDPNGRSQKEIPTPDIVDNEPSYVVSEIVYSR